MEISKKLIEELQNRLKVGSRRGVHLNAIPQRSRYKFDLHRLSYINKDIPQDFMKSLLTQNPLKFKITWKDNVPDLNTLFEEDQVKLVKITKSFENLINQTEAIESEKGINTFGFGFPVLVRRDRKDKKLTVAPVLVWSLKIKRTREFNTWYITREEEDPIYLNEVLINHLQNDADIKIDPISSQHLDDGLIDKNELLQICEDLVKAINSSPPANLREILEEKFKNIKAIQGKNHYEKLTAGTEDSFIDFGGLFSIFEVQKQNVIHDYQKLLDLEGAEIDLEDMEDHTFQSLSSIETDPSQQGILNSLKAKRNILIQGPPGTGKSQTLTAILVNALENHQKTIVVCEKRTALEVLYNSMKAKGLGKHCVLIKDSSKDRRLTIDSVRDRVESFRYNYSSYSSKSNLNEIIEKSKGLIGSINKKHLKLAKPLVGDKNWTQTVGTFLNESKKKTDNHELYIDKQIFDFTSEELNDLLETLRKGQNLYQDYRPNKDLTFLNTERYTGNNPFLIESNIKGVFGNYKVKLQNIKDKISAYKEEYIDIRTGEIEESLLKIEAELDNLENSIFSYKSTINELKNSYSIFRREEILDQYCQIYKFISQINKFYLEWPSSLSAFKEEYISLRKAEIAAQYLTIENPVQELQNIFSRNGASSLFYDDERKKSFGIRIQSIFSKEIRTILQDSKKLADTFIILAQRAGASQDFPELDITGSTANRKKNLKVFTSKVQKVLSALPEKISEEFNHLELETFLRDEIGDQSCFRNFEKHLLEKKKKSATYEFCSKVGAELEDKQRELKHLFQDLAEVLRSSKDFEFSGCKNSFEGRRKELEELQIQINTIKEKIGTTVSSEFNDTFPPNANTQYSLEKSLENLTQLIEAKESKDSNDIKEFWLTSLNQLEDYQRKFNTSFILLTRITSDSDDLEQFTFEGQLAERVQQIPALKMQLNASRGRIDQQVPEELKDLHFITYINEKYITSTYQSFKNEIELLAASIENDAWVEQGPKGRNDKGLVKYFEKLMETYDQFFNHEEDVFTTEFKWFKYYNNLSKENKSVIGQLLDKKDWRNVFIVHYLNNLLTKTANMHLPTDDREHIELEETLSKLGREQISYINHYWTAKQSLASRLFSQNNQDLSIENLFNKRKSKRFQKLSLRQIVRYDMDLFTDFFPVILTTPDVCSNLFQERNRYFDIVLFDEASQLKLEDNLPALLKGKQIVIAGDEHQMPPSNYFSKIFDGAIEDEDEFDDDDEMHFDRDNNLLSCESLLEFGEELNFQKRFLDFHYRSKHPYLIDFSNYAFYQQRLMPLPNKHDYRPISYIKVNGTYSDHTNEKEAEAILSILENNINRMPNGRYPSLGIATLNIAQRNLILSKILDRRKFDRFKAFNDKIVELEEEGFFIKNLENIQGDERDVIILSTTYGIGKDGNFAQRFGPINHKKGYKLLNVVITRAKYKIYVCSSIPERSFLEYKNLLITEGENNRRAVFYAYLAYAKAVSEGNEEMRLAVLHDLAENSTNKKKVLVPAHLGLESPFEEEVYQVLAEHFDEQKLIPQLQFAGFRIDLVYDPLNAGLPKIAIECDGAAYHSSQEAYLYDRHRQKTLEKNGFVFHRIWSTNWWRNPRREAEKLVSFIKEVEGRNPMLFEEANYPKVAFTDNIALIQNELRKNSPEVQKDIKREIRYTLDLFDQPKEPIYNEEEIMSEDEETIVALDNEETVEIKEPQEVITSKSKVTVNYLNSNQEIKVEFVVNDVFQPINTGGVMRINIKTPLAQALLGKGVGDTIKIGKLDNYVEILEVVNN